VGVGANGVVMFPALPAVAFVMFVPAVILPAVIFPPVWLPVIFCALTVLILAAAKIEIIAAKVTITGKTFGLLIIPLLSMAL
jgi:hypothetical protein